MINRTNHFSQEDLCRMRGDPAIGVISITAPGELAPLNEDAWSSVLRLQFHDLDEWHVGPEYANQIKFNLAHAQAILNWLTIYGSTVEAVWVHCALGISRSAAVALFIADRYDIPINRARASSYNKLVYRTLWDRWTSDPKVQQMILDRRSGQAYSRLW